MARSSIARRSRPRSFAPAVGALAIAAASLAPATALARDGGSSSEEVRLQLSWRAGPQALRLQPEGARLVLNLPSEWMPAPDFGRLGRPLDPNKYWRFRGPHQLTSASIGTGLRLSVEDRSRSLWFGISVLPRAAVAVLRFDPLPAQVR